MMNEALYDAIVVGSDGIYAVGTIMLDGARSRIYVVKFSKDLTTRIWTAQYRNFADSIWLDSPTSAKLSADGTKLIIEGDLDVLSANPRKVILEFSASTGALISAQ